MNCNEIDYELLIEEVKKAIRNGENNIYYIIANIFNKEDVENFTIAQILVSLDNEIKTAELKSFEYSKIEDLKIPWWKFWIDKCEKINEINRLKYLCAKRLAYMKKLPPPFPPLFYKY